ncbi:MAG: PEP-CTERM sorting domain-containing protein [Armatimonadetes bacterium]|nr:PEP-CTERM sorting domain-containing protein [Armatimonadota bacterium]
MSARSSLAAWTIFALAAGAAAQTYVLMPDSTNNRLVAFDPFDGSVVNGNLFALAGGTPLNAMQVGSEIWVSEQVGDRVSRWDLAGNSLGAISGALDNIRGMELFNGVVYVSNGGAANGAPGASLRMFDTSGNSLGHFTTPQVSSPFDVLAFQGDLLVANSSANDDIHRYTTAGSSGGTFHNSTSLNFVEQMDFALNGNVLAAGFSSNNIVWLDPTTGAITQSVTASGARGVFQLGNGNILWSNGSGAWVFDAATGGSTLVYSGGGRFFDTYVVPEPATLIALGVALASLAARRRTR